jgi:hypothetical protein
LECSNTVKDYPSIWSSAGKRGVAGKIVEGQEGQGGAGPRRAAPVGLREVCIQLFYICMRCLRLHEREGSGGKSALLG